MNEDPGVMGFGKFIPGFDFLKNLAGGQAQAGKGMASPLSGLGSWVAPTVSEEELDKRIQELKAVLFWLEQNATALKATIQALEVQKMTLATLAGMNMSMAEVAKAFTIQKPADTVAPQQKAASDQPWPFNVASAPGTATAAAAPEEDPSTEAEPEAAKPTSRSRAKKAASTEGAAPGAPDPLQWWGALTQQFQQIAADALREAAAQTPPARASNASGDAPPSATKEATSRRPAAKKKVTAKAAAGKKTAGKKAAVKQPAAKKVVASKSAAMPAVGGWPLPPTFRRK